MAASFIITIVEETFSFVVVTVAIVATVPLLLSCQHIFVATMPSCDQATESGCSSASFAHAAACSK